MTFSLAFLIYSAKFAYLALAVFGAPALPPVPLVPLLLSPDPSEAVAAAPSDPDDSELAAEAAWLVASICSTYSTSFDFFFGFGAGF